MCKHVKHGLTTCNLSVSELIDSIVVCFPTCRAYVGEGVALVSPTWARKPNHELDGLCAKYE